MVYKEDRSSEEQAREQLAEARAGIEAVDEQLVALLTQRCRYYDAVGAAKQTLDLPTKDSRVEVMKLADLAEQADSDVARRTVRAVMRAIMRVSRTYQYDRRNDEATHRQPSCLPKHIKNEFPDYRIVVTQGLDTSHAAKAAQELFPEATLLHTKTFSNAARQVTDNTAPVAVLPLENTTAGTVDEVYSLLEHEPLYIVRSLDMPIRHQLCVLPGTPLSAVRTLISHPQALAQCSIFTQTMGWSTEEIQNTAFAAARVKAEGRKDLAALASAEAAAAYGLDVLPMEIANEGSNTTRFIALAATPVVEEGADTLTLVCRLPHSKGSLANLLALLETYGLNLKKILSRPVPGRPWEYRFYLDIETEPVVYEEQAPAAGGPSGDCFKTLAPQPVQSALWALRQELEAVRFIGWYRQLK